MAVQNIGPKIKIDGYQQYKREMDSIVSATKRLQSEQAELEAKYTAGTTAAEKYKDKAALLNGVIAEQKKALDTNKEMLEKVKTEYGENSAEADKYRTVVANTETELANLRKELQQIPNEGEQFRRELKKQGEELEKLGGKIKEKGEKITDFGKTLTSSVTVPIVAAGAAAIKTTADFEKTMSQVAALSGAGKDDMTALSNAAKDLGASTAFTAQQVGEGMSYMALAGWDTQQMLAGIEPVLNLAAASGADLGTASDIVTDALTAFGLSAEDTTHFVDVLAQTSSSSNTTVEMMGEAFKYVAPLAGTLGYSIEDVSLALGVMANQSIKGSSAGTALRSVLSRLAKPTAEVQGTLDALGISLTDRRGEMKTLDELLGEMRSAFSGLSEAEAAEAATSIAGKNAMSGFLALVQTGDEDFNDLRTAIRNSDGAAKRMADTMLDNTAGAFTIMQSAIERASITMGEELTPYARKAAEKVTDLANAFSGMDAATKEVVIQMGGIAALAGPITIGLGAMVSSVGNIVEKSGQLINLLTAHPLGALFAVGAAAVTWVALQAHMTGVKSRTSELTKELDGLLGDIDSTNQGLESTKTALDKTLEGADGNAAAAGELITKIEELSQKEHLSNTEKALMAEYVSALNELYPEMNLQIDETGTALNKTTDEMRAYVDSMKASAQAEAVKDAYIEAVRLQTQAQLNANKAQEAYEKVAKKSAETERERKLLQMQVMALTEDRITGEKKLAELMQDGVITAEDYSEAMAAVERGEVSVGGASISLATAQGRLIQQEGNHIAEQKKAKEALDEANLSLETAKADVDALNVMYESSVTELAEMKTATESATTAVEANTTELQQNGKEMSKHSDYFAEMTDEELDLADAFVTKVDDMNAALGRSIESQMDMFEKFSAGTEISKEEILANMQSQIDGVRNWEQNIDTLMHRGVDVNILQRLIEMGPKGSNYVSAFVSMSDEELAQAGAMWTTSLNIQGMTDEWGETLKTDAPTAVSTGMDGVPELMGGYGTDSAKGFIEAYNKYKEENPIEAPDTGDGTEEDYYTEGQGKGAKYAEGLNDGYKAPSGIAAIKQTAGLIKEATAPVGVFDQNKGYGERGSLGVLSGLGQKVQAIKDRAKELREASAPTGIYKQNYGYGERGTEGVAAGMVTPTAHKQIMEAANANKTSSAPKGIWAFNKGYGQQGTAGVAAGMVDKQTHQQIMDAASANRKDSAPKGIWGFNKGYGQQGTAGVAAGMVDKETHQQIMDAAKANKTASAPKGIFDHNKDYGKQGTAGVASGLRDKEKVGEVTEAAGALKTAATPTGMKDAGKEAGKAVADGFGAGMSLQEKIDLVKEKARALAEQALNAINGKLKTGSPSRATRWSGQMAGEGFALGLEDEQSRVISAAEDVFDPAGFGFMAAGAGGSAGTNTTYGDTSVVLNVYGSEGQDVRELADIIEERIALNVRNRSAVWA